jgi:hypothetical protein
MSNPITDLMQQVHDHFLSLYQSKNSVVNRETFLSFDSGASPPISIETFRQPGQADFSEALAVEEFSNLVNQVPQLNANRFSPNGNQVEEQYEMLVLAGTGSGVTETDQVVFGRIRDQAEERLKNSKVGHARIGAPPIPYCKSFATPSNWYRPDAPNNWTRYSITIAQQSKTTDQTKPIFKPLVESAIALDTGKPWALQVLPETLKPVLSQPKMLDQIAVQEVIPELDRQLAKATPIRMKREELLRAAGETDGIIARPIVQELSSINFDRNLSQRIATFLPKEAIDRNLGDRVIRTPKKVNPVLVQPVTQPVTVQPVAVQAVQEAIAEPIFDRSRLIGRNWELQQIVNEHIFQQSQTETIKSSQISVSFDYCWVNIDRSWFYNPYLQMRNWYIPGLQAGDSTRALSAVPIAVLLVRNLRIQSDWQSQELQSVQSSVALGPFSLVGRSIEQGTGAIVQPGMQVMAWACQVMPTLPPSSSPT